MSSTQLYHRRSLFVRSSPPSKHDIHVPPSSAASDPQHGAITLTEIIVMCVFAFCIATATLGVITCIMSEIPLKLYLHRQAPYSSLAHNIHVELTMWGSLSTLILALPLWYSAEKIISTHWIVAARWFLLAAVLASPMPLGVALACSVVRGAFRHAIPPGFNFEHGLRLGLWGLVPETMLFFIYSAILKRFGCLPRLF